MKHVFRILTVSLITLTLCCGCGADPERMQQLAKQHQLPGKDVVADCQVAIDGQSAKRFIAVPGEAMHVVGELRLRDLPDFVPGSPLIRIVRRAKNGRDMIATAASAPPPERSPDGSYSFSADIRAPTALGAYRIKVVFQGSVVFESDLRIQ